jgi:hypothetical protein
LVSRVAFQDGRLDLSGLLQIVFLHGQVVLLGCLDVAVAGDFLDDMSGIPSWLCHAPVAMMQAAENRSRNDPSVGRRINFTWNG